MTCFNHVIINNRYIKSSLKRIITHYSRIKRLSSSSSSNNNNIINGTFQNIKETSSKSNKDESGLVFLKNTRRGSIKKRNPISSQQPPNGTVLSAPASLTQTIEHSPTHFLKGGLPCDPAAPPFQLASYGEESVYTLVLLRHGESEWNKQNRYTGWCDVNLTNEGVEEAKTAGRLLYNNGIEIDHCFTSVLRRAGVSANIALTSSNQHWVPITKTWRLNERHYGALQGYNKDTAYAELGIDQEIVMQMRRSYEKRPPIMQDEHLHWHGHDRRYRHLTQEQLDKTRAESLKDTADRVMPFYHKVILPAITAGNKCLVVSHANTLRTLIKHIDNISDEDIKSMSIPTGIPLLYRLDKDCKPVDPSIELEFRYLVQPKGYTWATSHNYGFHGVYLGDMHRLQKIQKKRDDTSRDWQRIILRNIAKKIIEENKAPLSTNRNYFSNETNEPKTMQEYGSTLNGDVSPHVLLEVRQLWWQIHSKLKSKKEYSNMILLQRMKDYLEEEILCHYSDSHVIRQTHKRPQQRYMTLFNYEKIISQIHLDMEGKVVEPFVELNEKMDRVEKARRWYAMQALDLEEEALIK